MKQSKNIKSALTKFEKSKKYQLEDAISLIKNIIEIIIDKQQDPKITLAINSSSKYRANTVNMLNKKPKAANNIVHLKIEIRLLKFKNCFCHSGGTCFS